MGVKSSWSTTTKIPLNYKKSQLILFLFIFVFSTQKLVYSQQKHQPSIKLVEPIARLLENGPVAQRLPETTCPTPSTEKDPINNVFSGIQFRVRWHDPAHLPVELAKLELFSSDSGGHLLSRLDIIKDEKRGMIDKNSSIVSMMAQIPEGLRCNLCTLRLSVELDERIQLVSCAQVSVKPAEKGVEEVEGEEKECKENKECLFGGNCFDGNCFCLNGRFGEYCKNGENPPTPTIPSLIQNSDSLQSIKFPESGTELKWLANIDKNIINLGLVFDEENKRKEAAKCKTRAKAGGGPLVRVEQEKGENSLTVDSTDSNNLNQIPSINKSSTSLNIRKLIEENTNKSETEKILSGTAIEECDTNQRWEQCPDSERECEPSCEWTAFPESIPVCPSRTSEQKCGKPRCVCVEGFVRLGKNLNECKPFSFCQAPEATPELIQDEIKNKEQVKQQKCPKNEIWEKCGNACEPTCQSMYSEEPCSSVCEMPGCTCTDNFVRLSVGGPCIEWTECPNLKERNEPKNASVSATVKTPQIGRLQCGANETINECGAVCEADCLSIFEREECHNCGKPSCACRQGYARSGGKCIYWGDCPAVNSLSTTTIQPEIKNNIKSTNIQELKESSPHKHSGQVSTTEKITTIEPSMDICKGEWKWPKGCGVGDKKCHYSIEWFLDQNSVGF
uniref:TIL domain-containing protein n=1 Tax=Meloidogyne floridensis TaxID=298350 RepID=A0A915P6S4_9BILA